VLFACLWGFEDYNSKFSKSLNKRKSKYDKRLFKPVRFQAPKRQVSG